MCPLCRKDFVEISKNEPEKNEDSRKAAMNVAAPSGFGNSIGSRGFAENNVRAFNRGLTKLKNILELISNLFILFLQLISDFYMGSSKL